jgi:phasin family protein
MASKDSKTSPTPSSIDAIVAAVAAPSESVPAALAATPNPVAAKPAAPKKRTIAALKPVAAAEPAAAQPVAASAPAAAMPAEPDAVALAPSITPPAPKPVAAPAAAVVQKEAEIMETIQSATENTQARAQAMFADVNDRTKTAMEKGSKMIEEMNEFSKGNIEALVESSKIAAKGIETLGQDAAEYGRKQLESATAAMKTLSSVKSPTEFLKLQSDYMRSAFDAMVAETSKNTESMLKLAGEIAQPISNRVAVAAEKIKVAA